MKNNHRRHTRAAIALCAGIIVTLTPLAAYLSYELAFRDRPYPGVTLENALEQNASATLTLRLAKQDAVSKVEKEWTTEPNEFNLRIDWTETQRHLLDVGRNGAFFDNLITKIRAYRNGVAVQPTLTYDRTLVESFVASVANETNISAIEPKFKLIDSRVVEFQQGVPGRFVQQDVLVDQIESALLDATVSRIIAVPISVQNPHQPPENLSAESLGIREKIGIGVSLYKHSIASRKYNVALTMSRLNGVLVAPGQTFSFNETIGDVSKATGYQSAYIIKDGRTILGDGGGVCQASTTLFRAVLNAGLPVVDRRAHSYRVSYYEQDSPPGIDATVYAPTDDFKFQNDTTSHILILANVGAGDTATIELWGTSDGRSATITKPVVTDQTPPPPDVYQDDPALRVGQVKQIDWKAWGAKVTFKYTVTRNGEALINKTFVSNYRPWQAVFLRGTGN